MAHWQRLARALAAAAMAASLVAAPVSSLAAPSAWLEIDGNVRMTDPPPAGIHDWANSGTASPINPCPAVPGVLNISGSGGLFNCGTGQARTWKDLVSAVFKAMGLKPNIKFIEMPDALKGKYQYFTQSDVTKLRKAGYTKPFTSLEDAVADYVAHLKA